MLTAVERDETQKKDIKLRRNLLKKGLSATSTAGGRRDAEKRCGGKTELEKRRSRCNANGGGRRDSQERHYAKTELIEKV